MKKALSLLLILATIALCPQTTALAAASSASANGIVYTNSKVGFSLTLPASWAGQYSVVPYATYVSFQHKESAKQTGGAGGSLFSIIRYNGKLKPEDVVGAGTRYIVAQTNESSYVLAYPSDAEYTDTTKAAYQKLAADIDKIGKTVTTVPRADTADPTYSAVGKIDGNGLTDNNIYTFANGSVDAAPRDCLLMINGEFSDVNVIIKSGCALVPVNTIQQVCDANVLWGYQASNGGIFPYGSDRGSSNMPLVIKISNADGSIDIKLTVGQTQADVGGKKETLGTAPVIKNNTAYVPLRFVCDLFGKAVGYLPANGEYVTNASNPNSAKGMAYNQIVWVDDLKKTNAAKPTDTTLTWLKDQMGQALTSLKNNLSTVDGGLLKSTDPNAPAFSQIENAINSTYYVGNVGRYAMYQGPYITLVDINTNTIYFYTIAHELGSIWKANMSDPETFVPMYFAD